MRYTEELREWKQLKFPSAQNINIVSAAASIYEARCSRFAL